MKSNEVIVNSNNTLKDVLVRFAPGAVKGKFAAPDQPVLGEASKTACTFRACRARSPGRSCRSKTTDKTMHNVHTYKGQETILNQGQPAGSSAIKKDNVATEAAILKFKCDVHPWMTGFLVVTDHPFFQTTGADGAFKLDKVPAGKYTLEAWHSKYGLKTTKVTVEAEQDRRSQVLLRRHRKGRIGEATLSSRAAPNARTTLCHRNGDRDVVLLIVGSLVHGTGSSLACPDWPLCYGTFFPKMENGVEYEHTHRLVATGVGIMTVTLTVLLFLKKQSAPFVKLGVAATVLVIFQGILGGITVLYKLPKAISIRASCDLDVLFLAHDCHRAAHVAFAPRAAAPLGAAAMSPSRGAASSRRSCSGARLRGPHEAAHHRAGAHDHRGGLWLGSRGRRALSWPRRSSATRSSSPAPTRSTCTSSATSTGAWSARKRPAAARRAHGAARRALVRRRALGRRRFPVLAIGVNASRRRCSRVLANLSYVLAYTPLKQRSHWALLVGAVPGRDAAAPRLDRGDRAHRCRRAGALRNPLSLADPAFSRDHAVPQRGVRARRPQGDAQHDRHARHQAQHRPLPVRARRGEPASRSARRRRATATWSSAGVLGAVFFGWGC